MNDTRQCESLSLDVITKLDEFESLQSEWDQLTSHTLRSFDWHFAWWNHFQDGKRLRIYCLREDDRLVGIFPMYLDQWLGQTRIRLIGSGDTCTDYAQLIGDSNWHDRFAEEIVQDIYQTLGMDMVELEGIRPMDAEPICRFLDEQRFWRYQRSLEPTWLLNLPATWNEFKSGSKKSLRRKIKKAESRLASDEFNVQSTREGLAIEEAFDILVDLHQDRFHSKGEPGVFADKRFTDFLRDSAYQLHSRDRIEILIAFYENQPLIAQFYLHHPDGPQLYQAGIRSSKMKLEPGHLLLTYAVRRAIENGASQFDFLRGDQAYKRYWGAEPCELHKVRMVSSRLLPSTVNRSYQLLRGVKHFCRNLTQLDGSRFEDANR